MEFRLKTVSDFELEKHCQGHGLRTPNEGIYQRNLKFWVDVAEKYASAVPKIWDWDLIFGSAVKAISSTGVRSPYSISSPGVRSPYFVGTIQALHTAYSAQ